MMNRPSTFSIVACDLAKEAWGVAVASKFLSVGAYVPWAQAGVGAVATQSYCNTSFGPRGLELMAGGLSAAEALDRLVSEDEGRDQRQVGMVDAQGRVASFTGKDCYDWAGQLLGPDFACQGNILAGPEILPAMAQAFEQAQGELAGRLVAALEAGEKAGGDRRGRQSAAVLVVKPQGGYGGFNDRYVDLRVDDDPHPVQRLQELLKLHHLYFGKSDPGDRIKIEGPLVVELQQILARQGYLHGQLSGVYDAATQAGLKAFSGTENLEERCFIDVGLIDPPALAYIRENFGV